MVIYYSCTNCSLYAS